MSTNTIAATSSSSSTKRALQLITQHNRLGGIELKSKRAEGRRESRIPKRFVGFYASFAGGEKQTTAASLGRRTKQIAPEGLALLQAAIQRAEQAVAAVQGGEEEEVVQEPVVEEKKEEEDAMDIEEEVYPRHPMMIPSTETLVNLAEPQREEESAEEIVRLPKASTGKVIDLVSSDDEEEESIDLGRPVPINKPTRVVWVNFADDVELKDADTVQHIYGPDFGL
jgi:hypothetical protein